MGRSSPRNNKIKLEYLKFSVSYEARVYKYLLESGPGVQLSHPCMAVNGCSEVGVLWL